jgi:hypothetical protein
VTKEQESKISEYLKTGIAIGLSTSRADRKRAEEILADVYKAGDLAPPQKVYWADSPIAGHKKVSEITGKKEWESPAFWGSQEISWLQFYRFFQVECQIEDAKKLEPLYMLATHVGWCWFYEDFAVLTEKPTKINMIEKATVLDTKSNIKLKVLHSTTDKAIEYADGTGWYFLNGINIPDWLITEPYNIERALKIENVEVRNEALKLGGPDVLITHCDAVEVDKKTINPGGNYTLYELTVSEKKRKYLRGECPSSGKAFTEAVPPEVKTVEEALYWREEGTIELPASGYVPPMFRT